jgi:hypothetical protein
VLRIVSQELNGIQALVNSDMKVNMVREALRFQWPEVKSFFS